MSIDYSMHSLRLYWFSYLLAALHAQSCDERLRSCIDMGTVHFIELFHPAYNYLILNTSTSLFMSFSHDGRDLIDTVQLFELIPFVGMVLYVSFHSIHCRSSIWVVLIIFIPHLIHPPTPDWTMVICPVHQLWCGYSRSKDSTRGGHTKYLGSYWLRLNRRYSY